jgi:hypothetical protein
MFDPKTGLMGFLGGSLVASAVFGPFPVWAEAGLLVMGILILLSMVFKAGGTVYMVTAILSFMAGFVAGFAMQLTQAGFQYTVIIFMAAVIAFTVRMVSAERDVLR